MRRFVRSILTPQPQVSGYTRLFREAVEQMGELDPTHVFIQVSGERALNDSRRH